MSTAASKTQTDARDAWGPLLELSAREVFRLMLGTELTAPPDPGSADGLNVTSIVGLAGSLCGLISVRCDTGAARLMGSKMLGIDVAEVEQEMWDAIGEVCNMVAGNFKNKISGMGDGCQLSVPTVITGDDYSLRAPGDERTLEVKLLFEEHLLMISLKLSD